MIETWFKNWHVQENQLYKLRNLERGAYQGRDAYYSEYGTSYLHQNSFTMIPSYVKPPAF